MKNVITDILDEAGVKLNGINLWDPQINLTKTTEERLLNRILLGGRLAIGESYMEEEWDVQDLEELFFRVTRNSDYSQLINTGNLIYYIKAIFFNFQSFTKSFEVARRHYNIGNDLFQVMLGKTMSYTNGYWKNTEDFETAMEQNLEIVCRKLDLKKGQRVLDIGCGWGNFMKYASEKYGVECVGLSVSVEQTKLGAERCRGLPIEFVITDYRKYKTDVKFDAIVSIESLEHIGPKNYSTFFEKVNSFLKDDGLFFMQVIGNGKSTNRVEPWFDKYIFPNACLPSLKQIVSALETSMPKRNLFVIESFEDLGTTYSKTLNSWFSNLERNYSEISKNNLIYDKTFFRMFKYYLLTSAGCFRSSKIFSWQFVMSKRGLN